MQRTEQHAPPRPGRTAGVHDDRGPTPARTTSENDDRGPAHTDSFRPRGGAYFPNKKCATSPSRMT